MPHLINPVPLVKALSNLDRKAVRQLYYLQFPNAAKSRFNECIWRDNFSALEKNYLLKLFIEQEGVMVLNYSDELMSLIL